jgi:outer membrane protein TolC
MPTARLSAYTPDQSEQRNTLPSPVFGREASLDDLIRFALANNPEIQVVHMQAHALEARVPQVRALDDPMLMTTTFLEPIQTAAGPQDVILNLSQKVPWFGK